MYIVWITIMVKWMFNICLVRLAASIKKSVASKNARIRCVQPPLLYMYSHHNVASSAICVVRNELETICGSLSASEISVPPTKNWFDKSRIFAAKSLIQIYRISDHHVQPEFRYY